MGMIGLNLASSGWMHCRGRVLGADMHLLLPETREPTRPKGFICTYMKEYASDRSRISVAYLS